MLYTVVEAAIFSVGLDPYLGIWHADQYNKPTLSYDLIEPFRPWMDALLIEQCLDDELTEAMFETKDGGGMGSQERKTAHYTAVSPVSE